MKSADPHWVSVRFLIKGFHQPCVSLSVCTQMKQMKPSCFLVPSPCQLHLQMKSLVRRVLLLLGHGSPLRVWEQGVGGSVGGRGPDEAALARGAPSARGSSKPVLLPRPVATICSINQSPGASGAKAHTHPQASILQQLLAQLIPHMALHPFSIPPSSLRSTPPDARTIFLHGAHMAQ